MRSRTRGKSQEEEEEETEAMLIRRPHWVGEQQSSKKAYGSFAKGCCVMPDKLKVMVDAPFPCLLVFLITPIERVTR